MSGTTRAGNAQVIYLAQPADLESFMALVKTGIFRRKTDKNIGEGGVDV